MTHALRRSALQFSILGACGSLLGGPLQAQTAPDAGSTLRDQQRTLPEPPKPAPALRIDEPARPALPREGLTRFRLERVQITGNTAFGSAELLPLVQEAIGQAVDFAALDELAGRISRYYRERGYLVARAYLPAQEIRDGAVEIAVIEGRVGRVAANNGSRVADAVVEAHTRGLAGGPVQERRLERALLLLNDLPGVGEARAGLGAGAQVGESDLAIELSGQPAWRGSVELDNHGNRYTGAPRLVGRLALLSPLGLGDALSGVLTRGFDGLGHGRLAYQLPLGGQGLQAGAALSHVNYRLGREFAALDRHGRATSATATLSYPFLRGSRLNLYGQLALDGSDLKDVDGAVGGTTAKSTRAASLTLYGDARDGFLDGNVSVFSLGYAAGRLTIDTPAARAVDEAAARAAGRYGKWSLSLLRQQSLGGPWSAALSFAGQKASKNLDSSEKFSLGGAQGVRAYPQGEASGDSGWVASAELRYSTTLGSLPGVLQPGVFIDAGEIRLNERPFDNGINHRKLAGAGLSLNWSLPGEFQLRLALATRLGREPATAGGPDRRSRAWLQVSWSF